MDVNFPHLINYNMYSGKNRANNNSINITASNINSTNKDVSLKQYIIRFIAKAITINEVAYSEELSCIFNFIIGL